MRIIAGLWSGSWTRLLILAACLPLMANQSQQQSGSKDCLKYINPDSLAPLKKYKHAALDQGCTVCHVDCRESSQTVGLQWMEPHYLKRKEPGLCRECHTALKQDLSKSHDNQSLEHVRCSGCHDPHSSNSPKRLPEVLHGPYGAKLCSSCHAAPPDGNVRFVAKTTDALCYECHADFKARIDAAENRHTLFSQSSASCVECHNPHGTNQKHILNMPVQDLCLKCHATDTEKKPQRGQPASSSEGTGGLPPDRSAKKSYGTLSSRYIHEPAKKSCLFCHDAHASDQPNELHASMPVLCMSCHGPNAEKIVHSTQPFSLFEGKSILEPKVFTKLSSLDLSLKYVHEPVSISCSYCHNPHSSDFPNELHAPLHDLCLGCHGTNAAKIVQSEHPFPLFDAQVSLPAKVFQTLKELSLSSDGKRGHPEKGHLVFAPAKDKGPEFNCLSCHTPHATDADEKLVVKHREFNCLDCHS